MTSIWVVELIDCKSRAACDCLCHRLTGKAYLRVKVTQRKAELREEKNQIFENVIFWKPEPATSEFFSCESQENPFSPHLRQFEFDFIHKKGGRRWHLSETYKIGQNHNLLFLQYFTASAAYLHIIAFEPHDDLMKLQNPYHYFHFTEEETEVQRSQVVYAEVQGWRVAELGHKSRLSAWPGGASEHKSGLVGREETGWDVGEHISQ